MNIVTNCIVLVGLFVTPLTALAVAPLEPNDAFRKEQLGLKFFKQEKYSEAFSILNQLAARGYKDSQYALAFMFLKGNHVEQSTRIGLSWLALATESKRKDWVAQFEMLYQATSIEEQQIIDNMIIDYTTKFGMQTQRVTCSKTTKNGSYRPVIKCLKGNYYTPLYDIDLVEPSN